MSQHLFPRHGRARRAWLGGLAALAGVVCLLLAQVPASALDAGGTPSSVTGNATWFSGLGSPYGGCGLPQGDLDTQNFLALNVQNSPGNYTNLPRPIPAADASEIGMFDNGLNDSAIPAGGSVTWGMVVNGSNQLLSGLSCTVS